VTLRLLDTNTMSDLVKDPRGRIRRGIATVGEANVLTSIIVACEMRFGAAKRGSIRLAEQIEAILGEIDVQPLGEDADRHYAILRRDLERRGTPIGSHDMLIAAHALSIDATLVTANTREFARVEGLKLENWLE
jgi:tRNA(fMet)-specific endonuclease VapC